MRSRRSRCSRPPSLSRASSAGRAGRPTSSRSSMSCCRVGHMAAYMAGPAAAVGGVRACAACRAGDLRLAAVWLKTKPLSPDGERVFIVRANEGTLGLPGRAAGVLAARPELVTSPAAAAPRATAGATAGIGLTLRDGRSADCAKPRLRSMRLGCPGADLPPRFCAAMWRVVASRRRNGRQICSRICAGSMRAFAAPLKKRHRDRQTRREAAIRGLRRSPLASGSLLVLRLHSAHFRRSDHGAGGRSPASRSLCCSSNRSSRPPNRRARYRPPATSRMAPVT